MRINAHNEGRQSLEEIGRIFKALSGQTRLRPAVLLYASGVNSVCVIRRSNGRAGVQNIPPFICSESCRNGRSKAGSQLAEGFLRHLAGDRFEVFSAGSEPKELNQLAVRVMTEGEINIGGQHSKSIDLFLGRETFHRTIFVCPNAEDNCPSIYPFALKKHSWPLDYPDLKVGAAATRLNAFRRVRDEIEKKTMTWLAALNQEQKYCSADVFCG